jgi:hypothetical protein
MTEINTKNIVELEQAFNRVMSKWNLGVLNGIVGSRLKLEDGLPWFEVYGNLAKSKAKEVVQDLANEMNIKVLLNRSESRSGELTIYGAFDVNPNVLDEQGAGVALPAYSDDPDAAEHMADYGKVYSPK